MKYTHTTKYKLSIKQLAGFKKMNIIRSFIASLLISTHLEKILYKETTEDYSTQYILINVFLKIRLLGLLLAIPLSIGLLIAQLFWEGFSDYKEAIHQFKENINYKRMLSYDLDKQFKIMDNEHLKRPFSILCEKIGLNLIQDWDFLNNLKDE